MPTRDEGRWATAAGSLEYLRRARGGLSRPMVVLCIGISALGVALMVMSGSMMLDGDFSSTGGRRSSWVTPPIAFLLGVGIALSPFAIAWQERRGVNDSSSQWDTVISLHRQGVTIHTWPPQGHQPWAEITDAAVADLPGPARAVVRYYVSHPERRAELGSRAALLRARSLEGP